MYSTFNLSYIFLFQLTSTHNNSSDLLGIGSTDGVCGQKSGTLLDLGLSLGGESTTDPTPVQNNTAGITNFNSPANTTNNSLTSVIPSAEQGHLK